MTTRRPCPPAPGPLEAYAARFDPLLASLTRGDWPKADLPPKGFFVVPAIYVRAR
jgi:hypothetical protein